MYRLIIEDDEGRKTIVPLIRNQLNIGREEGNTIRLTERNVSRRHAKLLLKDGQIMIEDLKSYNGVWINGSRINGRSPVRPGDLLEIGDYHLSVQAESSDADEKPTGPAKDEYDDQTPPLGIAPVEEEELEVVEIVAPDPAVIVLLNTSMQGQVFDVEWPAVTIGRTDENEIAIDHASISRHHVKIVCEEGVYKLYDLDSANGVLINGEEFTACDLRWGDIIELGQVKIRFSAAEEDLSAYVPATPPAAVEETVAAGSSESPKSLNTILIVALVLVLAGGGGIYTLLGGGGGKTPPPPRLSKDASSNVEPRRSQPRQRTDNLQQQLDRQLKLAEDLFAQENYKGALEILNNVIGKRPKWAKALELQKRCVYENANYKLIQESIEWQAEGNMFEAYKKLSKVSKQSRYLARAEDAKKQIAKKAFDEMMQKVRQAMAEKKYFEAIQFNSKALDVMPKNEEALKVHKQLEALTAPKGRKTPTRARPKSRDREAPARRAPRRRAVSVKVPGKYKNLKNCGGLFVSKKYSSARRCLKRLLRRKGEKNVPYAHLLLGHIAKSSGNCSATGKKRKHLLCLEANFHYKRFIALKPKAPEAAGLKSKSAPPARRDK